MVFDTFRSYYDFNYKAWDLDFQYRGEEQAEEWEVINLDEAVRKHQAPNEIKAQLDQLITPAVYSNMVGECDKIFLHQESFKTHQLDSTRIFESMHFPGWLIKIRTSQTRCLPMESEVKRLKAIKNQDRGTVWRPIRNSNLLRPSGKEYFVSHLNGLDNTFYFPEEYLYASPHADKLAPSHLKYFSVSQKMENIYTADETIQLLKQMNRDRQIDVANKVIAFIKSTRFHDWHRENLVMRKGEDSIFAMIDNEPIGLMIEDKDPGMHLFNPIEHVLLGMIRFRDTYCINCGLTNMANVAEGAILDYIAENPQAFNKKNLRIDNALFTQVNSWYRLLNFGAIIVSILIPLIPLALFLRAVYVNYPIARPNAQQFQRA